MIKPPTPKPNHLKSITNALKILKITASGGATIFLSTISSCYFAVVIEKTAHRVQYHFFPHWYKDVDFALGLDLGANKDMNQDTSMKQVKGNENGDTTTLEEGIVHEVIYTDSDRIGIDGEIGLHHSELHPYWQDNYDNDYDFRYNAQPQYGKDKFEIPRTAASASAPASTNGNWNENTTMYENNSVAPPSATTEENTIDDRRVSTSTFSYFQKLFVENNSNSSNDNSDGSDSMSSALQSCALTA